MNTSAPHPTSRAQSKQHTREALLAAGAALIAQNGYSGASVRDIAARAGYTQGAFYSNFKGKDDLVFEIMRLQFQEAYASISALKLTQPSSPAALAQDAAHWLQDVCGSDESVLLFTEISLHAIRDKEFAVTYDALHEDHAYKMAAKLDEIAQAGQLKLRGSTEQISKGMMALTRGVMLTMCRQKQPVGFDILRVFFESTLQAPDDV